VAVCSICFSDMHPKLIQVTVGDYEMLAGNLASIGVGAIIATVTSLIVRFFNCRRLSFLTFLSGRIIMTLNLRER
jgi:hypothetical protein